MLFPVEDVTDSDLQLRLSIGDDADRPPTPDGSRGDDEDEAKEMSARRPPETLTLSRNALREVSGNLLKNRALKYLYLEGNELRSIPPSLFTGSPNLLWLDLRHNQIQSVPTEIGRHRCLRTLLLEGNPITELPPELGNVLTLSGLNIRDCPLRYPPRGVLQRGVFSILQYLRAALAQRPVSAPKSLPDPPVVERLQLELMESGVDEDEEDELERFRELKLQMSLMETAEQENAAKPGQARAPPTPQRRKKKKAGGGVTPLQFNAPPSSKCEERRRAELREAREKEAVLEQRRRSQEALRKWWSRAKDPQQAGHRQKKPRPPRLKEEADQRPAAEEEDGGDFARRQQANGDSEYEESSAVQKLRRDIYAIVHKMEERRRNPTSSREEQMEAAERDMREMRRLQAQILDVKRGRRFALNTGRS